MPETCLIVRVASSQRDADKFLGVVSDYADEQFEQYTMDHGRPMNMVSWTEPADLRHKEARALAAILDWWEGISNDTRGLLCDDDRDPPCIRRAYAITRPREK